MKTENSAVANFSHKKVNGNICFYVVSISCIFSKAVQHFDGRIISVHACTSHPPVCGSHMCTVAMPDYNITMPEGGGMRLPLKKARAVYL